MFGVLTAYATTAVVKQCQAIVAGYTSRQGTPLAIPVARSASANPASMALPAAWVQALPPDQLVPNLLGDVLGVANDGTSVTRGLLFDEDSPLRVDLGARARQPAERDDLFDYLALALLLGTDPTTQMPWKQDLWSTYGLQPLGIGRPVYSTVELTGAGQVFEVRAQLFLLGQLAVTFATTPIASVTLGPSIDAGAFTAI